MTDLLLNALRRKLTAAEQAGDKKRAKLIRERLGEAEADAEDAQESTEDTGDDLDNVSFASPAARATAEDAGLDAESFKRRRKSSDAGFTKADVEKIAGTDENEEESD